MPECITLNSSVRFTRLTLGLSVLILFSAFITKAQTLTTEFVDAGYSLFDVGSVPGVPTNYGGLTIRPEEPNTLYIGGSANNASGALYSIELVRDEETNQVTGFSGTATLVVATPDVDGGVLFAPNGTLLFTQYSQNGLGQVLTDDTYITTNLTQYGITSSVGSLMLVPSGFDGAGNLIIASYSGSTVYNVPYSISETGEYLLSEQTASVALGGTAGGPEGIAYIPQGSDGFPNPSMVISSYGSGKVVVFDTDAIGLPDVASARDMITGLTGAEGALIDPVTGDFLFSTFGGGNNVIVVSGFENPNDCAGVPFGESVLDDCGVCRLPDDPDFNTTCLDCAGEINGTAFIDDCGDCVGGNTGQEACVFDCQEILANIGDACDDGNEFTENDVIGSNCECSGEIIPQENNSIACADGIDNDNDGLTDCDDPECQALSSACSTCFLDGSSFADEVIDYNNTCPNNIYTDPSEALGVPDFNVNGEANHATLGEGGYITLGFTDNTLVNSGNDDPDLFVFEVGPAVEGSTIELRPLNIETENQLIDEGLIDSDEDGFYEFGAISGATAVVDIDSFFDGVPAGTLLFDAIKITDIPGNCSGSSPGADIDGVCALSSVPCAIGSSCDDGDDMTENDIINDECECVGEPIATATLLDLECGGQVIQITGAVSGDNAGGTATAETRTVYAFAPDGVGGIPTYTGSAWPYVILSGSISVDGTISAIITTNEEGVLLVNGLPAYQFTGDASSTDASGTFGPWSYFLADGTPSQDACPEVFDCPILEANIGDICDDNDDMTENDMVSASCECAGTPIIVFDCPDLEANIGDDCDDQDDMTENDMVNANCECEGTPIIVFDCPALEANIGDACDDGDDMTENDVVGDDCICSGTPIIVFDCPAIGANIGDACDDGDDMTENDMIGDDCNCAGTPIMVECLADGGIISFEGGSSTVEVCVNDQEPSFVSIDVIEPASDDYMTSWVITDLDGNLLGIPGSEEAVEEINFDDAGPGNCLIWVVNFDLDDSNLAELAEAFENGEDVNASDLEGCYDLSDAIEVVRLECGPTFDCPELGANIGDACDDDNPETQNDVVNASCNCAGTPIEPSDCEDWVMYLNNNLGGVTDIYRVDISSGDAELTYITTLGYQGHIAYNPEDNLIYVINNMNASYVTVNPHTAIPIVSFPVFLSQDIESITTAAFAPNGKLLMGTMTEDVIYSVNVDDQMVSVFDAFAPINGGDIAFDDSGMLYLATRSGNGFYEVYPDDVLADQLIGTVPSLVTGMALTESNQMIMSHKANSDLLLRNLDGSDAMVSYPLMLDGSPYAHADGDMTSGCNTFQDENEGECEAFSTFYIDHAPGSGSGTLYSVAFSGEEATLALETTVDFPAHIGYNAMDNIVYLVNPNGAFIRAYDPTTDTFLGDLPIVGDISGLVSVVYNPEDGFLYVGSPSNGIHAIDLGTGVATFFADAPVSGGDLAIQDGKLYLATRNGNKLYEIAGGIALEIGDIPSQVNGMAQANNSSDVVIANFQAGSFTQLTAADASVVTTFAAVLDGSPFTTLNGDMAAGCADTEPSEETGACNATEVIEYIQGTTLGGGAIATNRTDSSQALGVPERTDEMVFTTLGYGGSITFGFDGAVPNGPGDDIEVVETSFNTPGCESYPEYAYVSVSMDGITWLSAGTVCKGERFVDISDAGDLEYVMHVRVSNIDAQTSTSDGFDVDGIVALHNCDEETGVDENNELSIIAGMSSINSFPNPTNGPSQVVFVASETGLTLIEVYDMNGRNVSTLYNEVAQAGMEYRLDFNGSNLPNGVYIYKMTTNKESIINKFMIAR